jgi:hypothetical protein
MMHKKMNFCLSLAAMFLLMGNVTLVLAKSPFQKGDVMPSITLQAPEDPAQRRYLGLEKEGLFEIPQIKADIVIIEIFSMY